MARTKTKAKAEAKTKNKTKNNVYNLEVDKEIFITLWAKTKPKTGYHHPQKEPYSLFHQLQNQHFVKMP